MHLLLQTISKRTPRLILQVFARKLIRPFGDITTEEILKEAKVLSKFAMNVDAKNLVSVIRHGWLADTPYYYIDMELCEANLTEYIAARDPLTYELCTHVSLRVQISWIVEYLGYHGASF